MFIAFYRFRAVRGVYGLAMLAVAVAAQPAGAQETSRARAAELSRSWAALAQGEYARAEKIGTTLLQGNPADHDAVTVSIAASVGAGRSGTALDRYESWLRLSRHEDIFLLQPIAGGMLSEIAAGTDVGLAIEALNRLV